MDLEAVGRYQGRSVSEASALLSQGLDAKLIAPVGAGKTNMTLDIASGEIARGGRVGVIQQTKSLTRQSASRAAEAGFDVRTAMGGTTERGGDVVYGIVDTVAADPAAFGRVSLLVIDEGHHASREGRHADVIDALGRMNPGMRILMTTATEDRADGAALHPRLENAGRVLVTWREAMDAGMVVPMETVQGTVRFADGSTFQERARAMIDPEDPSRSAVGINGMMARERPDDVIDQWANQYLRRPAMRGTQSLFFMDRRDDADALAARLVASGANVAAIHSGMRDDVVSGRIAAYNAGRLNGLVSVDMIGEGFDAPATRTLVNCKGTTSALEYLQLLGRGSRSSLGKASCNMLDLGASSMIHGRLDVLAEVQSYLGNAGPGAARRDGEAARRTWRAWVPCGKDTVGMDLGQRSLFATRVGKDPEAYVVTTTSTGKDGRVLIAKVGTMGRRDVRTLGREAVASARRTVITLSSDVLEDGRTRMQSRLEAAMAKHGKSIALIAGQEHGKVAPNADRRRAAGMGSGR